ncbi:MAG: DUF2278 family protein, partial [Capsulimonadales bacterium]|nr:DUF2278 family protein [Capsulimonadales bacterium]
DYIRGNLFDPTEMRPLPFDVPGPDNDLNERVGFHLGRALRDPNARLFAFGARFGPEHAPDKIFGFRPGNGVHDVHMNQGNDHRHRRDDGVFQDGGLIVHFPGTGQTVAIFLAFQSQVWHTDDLRGHALPGFRPGPARSPRHPIGLPRPVEPSPVLPEPPPPYPWENAIRIVAALVNPSGNDGVPHPETITLLNTTAETISLSGWQIADASKNTMDLGPLGTLAAGETLRVVSDGSINLGNKGGIITVLREGIKVHGVSYTRDQAEVEGATLFFA